MADRKRLSDILLNSERERLAQSWESTRAADDPTPIPSGEYLCRIVGGELFASRSGTPGYKLALEVSSGEHVGRRLWHDIWLSPAALAMAKRDLGKLGVTNPEQLEQPLPDGFVVIARVALRRGDDGTEFNRVVRFEVVAFEPPGPDPFAPEPDGRDADGFDWWTGEQKGAPDR